MMHIIKNKNLSRGFTLIELMVVISIIALVSGISVFALNDARRSGRDAKRRADLAQIASGLELYKADLNFYPSSISFGSSLTGGGNTYINVIPNDPDTSNNYIYRPTPSGCTDCTGFSLWASMEETSTPATGCPTVPGGCGGTCNFCITNP